MRTMNRDEDTTPSSVEKDVAEIVARYEDAFNTNDAKAMNSLFSRDTTFVNFSGNLVFGADRLYEAQAFVFAEGGPLADISVTYTVEGISLLTPEIAVLHARQRSAGTGDRAQHPNEGGGDRDPMEGILTMTLMRDPAGEWLIRTAQNTPVAAPR